MKKVFITFLIFITIAMTGCLYNPSNSPSNRTRSATTSDIIIDFHLNSGFFTSDTYYVNIQAQEKIYNLSLNIDFLTSQNVVMKSEILYVGKVVPGNNYRFELNQGGLDPDDLNKITRFKFRIETGTVELES